MKEPSECVTCFVYERQGEVVPLHGHKSWSQCTEAEREIATRWGYPNRLRSGARGVNCPNGHEVREGDRFCGRCGVPLVDLSPQELHEHTEAMIRAAIRWRNERKTS